MTCFTPVNTKGIAGVFSSDFSVLFVSVLVSLILIRPLLKLFLERVFRAGALQLKYLYSEFGSAKCFCLLL